MRVDEAVAHALSEQGTEYLFGADTFGEGCKGLVSAIDVSAAVGMADGYARASGKVGVVAIDPLRRLAGAIPALVEATRSRTPLVALCPSPKPEPGPRSPTPAMWIPGVGAAHDQVFDPGSIVRDLDRAFQRTVTEERPVVVEVPTELLEVESGDLPPVARPVPPGPRGFSADSLDVALGVIATAHRPVVLAGWGAVVSGAGGELVRLADRIGGVLATTLRAKGYFRGQPRDVGICGRLSTESAATMIAEADCVVAFGASLNRFTTLGGALVEGKNVIHVDHDPAQLGLTTPVTAAVSGDALLVARAMNAALEEAGHSPITRWAQQVETRLDEATGAGLDTPDPSSTDIASVMCGLNEMLPPERTLVCDMGHFVVDVWRQVDVAHPGRLINMNSSGSPGLGLAGGVGAAIHRRGEMALVVLDDEALIAAPAALVTAVTERLPVLAAVCNHGSSDLAQFATGLGAEVATIHDVGELSATKSWLGHLEGPMILDLRLPVEV